MIQQKDINIFDNWIKENIISKSQDTDDNGILTLDDWLKIHKQVSLNSGVNWNDYKQEMPKVKNLNSDGNVSNTGFTLPPRRRDSAHERNFKLIPEKVMVRRAGGMPYFATRWKQVKTDNSQGFKIIPVDNYSGDISLLLNVWTDYVQNNSDSDSFVVPLVALQEIIHKQYDGILIQFEKRIVGIASIKIDENENAEISILSASPMDIDTDGEDKIEDALVAGVGQYFQHKGYHSESDLFYDNDDDVNEEDNVDDVNEKDNVDTEEDDDVDNDEEDILKAKKESQPQTIYEMMVIRGLYPRTGNPKNPGRWVRKNAYIKYLDEQGEDSSAIVSQMDDYRKQFKNDNFHQMGDAYLQYNDKKTKQLSQLRRDEKGKFKKLDDSAGIEVDEESNIESIRAVIGVQLMNDVPPSIDEVGVPDSGAVIPFQNPAGSKLPARRASKYVPLSELFREREDGESIEEYGKARRQWFNKEYLQGRGVYKASVQIPLHWENIELAANPSDKNVDLLVKAVDPRMIEVPDEGGVVRQQHQANQYIYSSEYEKQQSKASYSRINAFMKWSDHIEARIIKDLNGTAPKTKRLTEEQATARLQNVALGLALQNELYLRAGNEQNIASQSRRDTGMQNKGVNQLQKSDVKFIEDEGELKAILNFQGKHGVPFTDLVLSKPELVDALKRRYDATEGEKDRLFFYNQTFDNDYMSEITNGWFTPKDFRTMHSNRMAIEWGNNLYDEDKLPTNPTQFLSAVKEMGEYVKGVMNHSTVRTTFRSYISPAAIIEMGRNVQDKVGLVRAYYKLPNVMDLPDDVLEYIAKTSNEKIDPADLQPEMLGAAQGLEGVRRGRGRPKKEKTDDEVKKSLNVIDLLEWL